MSRLRAVMCCLLAALGVVAPAAAGARDRGSGWTDGQAAAVFGELERDLDAAPEAKTAPRSAHPLPSGPVRGAGGADKAALRRSARRIAAAHGIDSSFYESLVGWESGYLPLLGNSGEIGYSQCLVSTARPYFLSGQLTGSLWAAETNLTAGVLFLADLKRLIGPKERAYMRRHGLAELHVLAAAYNCGWGSFSKLVKQDKFLSPRMQSYIRNVHRTYLKYKRDPV